MQKIRKLVLLLFVVLLVVCNGENVVKATTANMYYEGEAKEYTLNLTRERVRQVLMGALSSNGHSSDVKFKLQNQVSTNKEVYPGSFKGKIAANSQYRLHTISIAKGEYFQARLIMPKVKKLDYDLILYNENFELVKASDYVTYENENGTIDEVIGYLADRDAKMYLCVYDVGSVHSTAEYTVEYAFIENFSDENEPDNYAGEAHRISMENGGTPETGTINSSVDEDWYVFDVLDTPDYYNIRFELTDEKNNNLCKLELYYNVASSNYYGMQLIGQGNGGDVKLQPGRYYLRVISIKSFDDFSSDDIVDYTVAVLPVASVDEVNITELNGHNRYTPSYSGSENVRIEEFDPNILVVKGTAYYLDEKGIKHPSVNARIEIVVTDYDWKELNRPDMAIVQSYAYVNTAGGYRADVYLNSAVGARRESGTRSVHHYDLMNVLCRAGSGEASRDFELLKYSE